MCPGHISSIDKKLVSIHIVQIYSKQLPVQGHSDAEVTPNRLVSAGVMVWPAGSDLVKQF